MVRLLVTAANFADFSILKGQNTAIFGVPYRLLSTKLPRTLTKVALVIYRHYSQD